MLGVVKFSKNNNLDKNRYSDYVIGFDSRLQFFYGQAVAWVKNVINFAVDMRSSVHVDNKKERYLSSW